MRKLVAGFTLTELLIVMTIVAILVSIAIPSYSEYMRRGRRMDAQSYMQEVAARQQHFLVDRRAYSTSLSASGGAGGLGMTIPTNVSTYYTLALSASNVAGAPPTFVVTATPVGSQTGERCGELTLTSSGVKTAAGAGNCW